MSAARLREAAKVLRERAEAATPGPWQAVAGAWGLPSDGPDHMRVLQPPHHNASDALARLEYDRQGGDDAAYIATVHPLVGLALADWLDAEADEQRWGRTRDFDAEGISARIADLILGGEGAR